MSAQGANSHEAMRGYFDFWEGVPHDRPPYVNRQQIEQWQLGWSIGEADDIADAEGWPRDGKVAGH